MNLEKRKEKLLRKCRKLALKIETYQEKRDFYINEIKVINIIKGE